MPEIARPLLPALLVLLLVVMLMIVAGVTVKALPANAQPVSVYFSPDAKEADPAGGVAVKRVPKYGNSGWANPSISCDTSLAIERVPPTATALAGWSLGRLGPIYALARASATQEQQITYILMIDPGGYNQMATGCDSSKLQITLFKYETAGQILAGWLRDNPSAHLVILAGDVTADPLNTVNGYAHAGIQNFYFNDIRAAGSSAVSRTLVCNYSVPGTNVHDNNSLENSHHVMYEHTNQFIQGPPLTSCPSVSGLIQGDSWHPSAGSTPPTPTQPAKPTPAPTPTLTPAPPTLTPTPGPGQTTYAEQGGTTAPIPSPTHTTPRAWDLTKYPQERGCTSRARCMPQPSRAPTRTAIGT